MEAELSGADAERASRLSDFYRALGARMEGQTASDVWAKEEIKALYERLVSPTDETSEQLFDRLCWEFEQQRRPRD